MSSSVSTPPQVGEFRLGELLGEGGMGQVFLARSIVSGRPVAVKLIRPEFASDRTFMTRFRREIEAVRLVSGAFTAPPVAAGPDDIPPWVATEFIPGPSLRKLVAAGGPLPEAAVWNLGGSLVEALREIHRHDLVHRDLKPENILIAADGPRVIDFGISLDLKRTALTGADLTPGTLLYMSPEQLDSSRVGPASDVFSLGSVIAFAATRSEPFAADHAAAIIYRIANGDPDLSALSPRQRDLVAACLIKDPVLRPSLDQLSSAIKAGRAPFPEAASGQYWPDPVARLLQTMIAPIAAAGSAAPRSARPSREPAVTKPPPETAPVAAQQTSPPAGPTQFREPPPRPAPGPGPQPAAREPHMPPGQRPRAVRRRWHAAAVGLATIIVAAGATALALHGGPAGSHQSGTTPPASPPHSSHPGKRPSHAATQQQVTVPPTYVTVCTWPGTQACTGSGGQEFMASQPAEITASQDGSVTVENITWSGWGTPHATGTGTLWAPGPISPATVTLTDLVAYTTGGRRYEAYANVAIRSPSRTYDYTTGTVP